MQERMYNVIKYHRIGSENFDYLLRKNDVIKMGRVKLKIKNIVNVDKKKDKEMKQKRRQQRILNYIDRKRNAEQE